MVLVVALTIEELGARILTWRCRLSKAKTKGELLSIWGEIETMESAFDAAVFENRSSVWTPVDDD